MKSKRWVHPVWLLSFMLTFTFSCTNNVKYEPAFTWSPVEINEEISGSEEIESVIAPYRGRLDSIMDEVIGYAVHDLTTEGKYESTLGTFVNQLLLEQSISIFNSNVDVTIINHHGGLRAPINQGEITLGEIYAVMPFENNMQLLKVPGDVLLQVIERAGESGRSMLWPVGFQVTEEGLEDITIAGEPLDTEKNYVMAISDYIANGGGGFKMLIPMERIDIETIKLRDLIVKEIRERTSRGDSVSAEVVNAITDLTQ